VDFSRIKKFSDRFKLVGEVLYKKCTECKLFIEHAKFTKAKNTSDKKTPNCNECRRKKLNNSKQREYYRARGKEKKSKYFKDNRDRIYKQREEKRNTCPIHNTYIRMRKFVRKSRLLSKQYPRNNTMQVIGCSKTELLSHLISTFEVNYKIKYNDEYFKDLHIDHVIPLSTGNCYEDFLKLNHYTNLQFLHKIHNMEKKDKVEYNIPEFPIHLYNFSGEV
jgi:hypothetical protein